MCKHPSRILVAFVFSLAFLIILPGHGFAAKEPRIKFREAVYDFGKVKQGDVLKHEFAFKNEGEATLIIHKVSTSCGCAAALASEDKIQPGKEGKIEVKFDTKGYGGRVSKLVYVDSNDPQEPHMQLEVAADIDVPPQPKIELDPYNFDAGLLLEGEDINAKVKIENKGEMELRVECSHRNAVFLIAGKSASFPLKVASGKGVDMMVRIPSQKRTGLLREYVLFKTNDPLRSTVSLYVSGYIITKQQLKELFSKYKNVIN